MATTSLTAPLTKPPSSLNLRRSTTTMMIGKYKGTQMRAKKLRDMIETKVKEAKQVCQGEGRRSDGCKVAWDQVEEVSQAMADLRRKLDKHQDPLHFFCLENPDTDECLVDYDCV